MHRHLVQLTARRVCLHHAPIGVEHDARVRGLQRDGRVAGRNEGDERGCERGVELDFSRPGKPTDTAAVESFNGRLRQECLNAHWFLLFVIGRRTSQV